MDDAAAVRRDRLLHRQPGDLMAEPQRPAVPGQQPGREDLIRDLRRARAERGRQALAAQNSSFLFQLAVGRAAVLVSRMGCGGRDR